MGPNFQIGINGGAIASLMLLYLATFCSSGCSGASCEQRISLQGIAACKMLATVSQGPSDKGSPCNGLHSFHLKLAKY